LVSIVERVPEADPRTPVLERALVVRAGRFQWKGAVGIVRAFECSADMVSAPRRNIERAIARLLPAIQVFAGRAADPLNPPAILAADPGVEHPPAALLPGIGRDVHRPQHVVVPAPGMTDGHRILDPLPVQP